MNIDMVKPIPASQQVSQPSQIATVDPSDQQQEQKQEKDQGEDGDDGSADAALGLINTGPVQLKTDLEEPVTSGGMNTMIDEPGNPD
jgi:hypothetical protein